MEFTPLLNIYHAITSLKSFCNLLTFQFVSICSKFWCRNRPGDEMKDGYNSLVSALVLGEDETDGIILLHSAAVSLCYVCMVAS